MKWSVYCSSVCIGCVQGFNAGWNDSFLSLSINQKLGLTGSLMHDNIATQCFFQLTQMRKKYISADSAFVSFPLHTEGSNLKHYCPLYEEGSNVWDIISIVSIYCSHRFPYRRGISKAEQHATCPVWHAVFLLVKGRADVFSRGKTLMYDNFTLTIVLIHVWTQIIAISLSTANSFAA